MSSQRPIFVGHRGYPAMYPENTLAGFRAALEAGALAVECDIQFSRDGVPMVIHDPSLERTTDDQGKVAERLAADLVSISAHEPLRFGQEKWPEPLPTLAQLVELMEQFPNAILFAEIKEEIFDDFARDQCVEKVMDVLRPLGNRFVIISFDAEVLPLARRAGAAIGWVIKRYNKKSQHTATALAPEFLICNYRKLPPMPTALWSGHWRWFVYDIVDFPVAKKCVERGVVYIETWDIGAMLAVEFGH